MQIWTSPSEEEEEEEEQAEEEQQQQPQEEEQEHILAIWRLSGSVLSRCFLAPLGVLFVMKTLEDEW